MRERALRFGPERLLVGILAEPTADEPSSDLGVIFLNSGLLHRVGASRLHVQIARQLAPAGVASLRFDLSGVGDSDTRTDGLPFQQSAVLETQAAMDELARLRGVTRFVLYGLCSGSDVAYYTGLADTRVVGLVQLDPFVYHTLRYAMHRIAPRVLNAESWTNLLLGKTYLVPWLRKRLGSAEPRDGAVDLADENVVHNPYARAFPPKAEIESGLTTLCRRGVAQLAILSAGQLEHANHGGQYEQCFAQVPFGDLLSTAWRGAADHTFTPLAEQAFVVEATTRWIASRVASATAAATAVAVPAAL